MFPLLLLGYDMGGPRGTSGAGGGFEEVFEKSEPGR
jgi:hypothetical protein